MTRRRLHLLLAVLLLWLASGAWQVVKPLPAGMGQAGPWRPAVQVQFLADRTFVDASGQRHSEQAIFDRVFALIGQARQLVMLDMFLFNDFGSPDDAVLRPLSDELTQALLDRMDEVPALRVVVITDPVNTVYGSVASRHLDALEQAGAQVTITDLARLPASNPAWSGPWTLCCAWLGNRIGAGWLPNPLGDAPITLRSWLALPNFRANHRKTLVVDRGDGWQAMVMSANPHDGSSAHDNVALQLSGAAALDVLDGEAAVAAFSGTPLAGLPQADPAAAPPALPRLRTLSEKAVRTAVLATLDDAGPADRLDIAMFYLADRAVVRALARAARRGVPVRLLLDPNEDAFGRKKNGVPNRPVAAELVRAGVDVRWCDTHGEQCHSKFLLRHSQDAATLILGSANWTRRNLRNLNLELDVQLVAPPSHAAMADARRWFDAQWTNPGRHHYSTDYARYRDERLWPRVLYRLGEHTGLSTW